MNNNNFFFGIGQAKWITLENGTTKLFHSFNDANSWSVQQKYPIVSTKDLTIGVPVNYNPSKESVKESHILLGGKESDFIEDFINDAD